MTKRTSKKKSSKRRTSKRSPGASLRSNYRAPTRGWSYSDDREPEDENDLRAKIRREMIDKLASEWNDLNSKLEERSFRSDEDREAEADAMADRAADYADEKLGLWVQEQIGQGAPFDENVLNKPQRQWPSEVLEQHQKFTDEFYQNDKKHGDDTGLRMQVVEELLGELGARMMRPYEHWNEDERYMEWSERDRGDEDW
jgi:hypothetical protein